MLTIVWRRAGAGSYTQSQLLDFGVGMGNCVDWTSSKKRLVDTSSSVTIETRVDAVTTFVNARESQSEAWVYRNLNLNLVLTTVYVQGSL